MGRVVHVLGAGSVGCLWSTRLALAGARPKLLLRSGSPKAEKCLPSGLARLKLENAYVQSHKASEQPPFKETVDVPVEISHVTDAATDIHTLIVATKAPDTVCALQGIASRIVPEAVVVFLGNGLLCVLDRVRAASLLTTSHLVLCTSTHGSWSRGDFDIVHAGFGSTMIGCVPGSTMNTTEYRKLFDVLSSCGLGGEECSEDVIRRMWMKLAPNAVINPLTSLWEVSNGEILQREEGLVTMQRVCREIAEVAKACFRKHTCQGISTQPPSAEEFEDAVRCTAEKTTLNRSSMLQDIVAGRPTEIEYISGWVMEKGHDLGIPTPANEELFRRVREKENAISRRP